MWNGKTDVTRLMKLEIVKKNRENEKRDFYLIKKYVIIYSENNNLVLVGRERK